MDFGRIQALKTKRRSSPHWKNDTRLEERRGAKYNALVEDEDDLSQQPPPLQEILSVNSHYHHEEEVEEESEDVVFTQTTTTTTTSTAPVVVTPRKTKIVHNDTPSTNTPANHSPKSVHAFDPNWDEYHAVFGQPFEEQEDVFFNKDEPAVADTVVPTHQVVVENEPLVVTTRIHVISAYEEELLQLVEGEGVPVPQAEDPVSPLVLEEEEEEEDLYSPRIEEIPPSTPTANPRSVVDDDAFFNAIFEDDDNGDEPLPPATPLKGRRKSMDWEARQTQLEELDLAAMLARKEDDSSNYRPSPGRPAVLKTPLFPKSLMELKANIREGVSSWKDLFGDIVGEVTLCAKDMTTECQPGDAAANMDAQYTFDTEQNDGILESIPSQDRSLLPQEKKARRGGTPPKLSISQQQQQGPWVISGSMISPSQSMVEEKEESKEARRGGTSPKASNIQQQQQGPWVISGSMISPSQSMADEGESYPPPPALKRINKKIHPNSQKKGSLPFSIGTSPQEEEDTTQYQPPIEAMVRPRHENTRRDDAVVVVITGEYLNIRSITDDDEKERKNNATPSQPLLELPGDDSQPLRLCLLIDEYDPRKYTQVLKELIGNYQIIQLDIHRARSKRSRHRTNHDLLSLFSVLETLPSLQGLHLQDFESHQLELIPFEELLESNPQLTSLEIRTSDEPEMDNILTRQGYLI